MQDIKSYTKVTWPSTNTIVDVGYHKDMTCQYTWMVNQAYL